MADITTAGTAIATDINPITTAIFLGSGGTITQGGPIVVNTLIEAGGGATSELGISQLVNVGSGDVALTSSGAVYGGTGTNDISSGTLSVTVNGTSTRGSSIGSIDGLHTRCSASLR